VLFITIQEDVPFPIIPNICFLNLPLVIIRTVLKKVKDFFSTCSVNQETKVTVHTPLSREVFWHEYAKIPRHTSQNSIAAGNLE